MVLLGAILNTSLFYLFWVENLTLHAILLFLTAAMDNPYRGHFSVSPDGFQELLDTVMTVPAK